MEEGRPWKRSRKLNRWQKWDYSDFGFYFITICTKDKMEYFGEVRDGMIALNEFGEIANKCWLDIEKHFKNVHIDEFIVMPNHIHGILLVNDASVIVGDRHACPLREEAENDRQYQTIPAVVGSFKSSVTRLINSQQHQFQFQWQRSFYDHVIRDEISLQKIRQYILNNPINWIRDRNNSENIYYK